MTTPSNSPIVNAGLLYVNGLQIDFTSATTFTVRSGQARDSTNTIDMATTQTTTITTARTGLNGLDTGTIAASTWYAVYMIASSTNQAVTGFVISTSTTAPVLPNHNYDSFRRIGWIVTNSSVQLTVFVITGTGTVRNYLLYVDGIAALTNGNATTATPISLIGFAPPQTGEVFLNTQFTPNAAADVYSIAPSGGSGINLKGSVAAVQQIIPLRITAILISGAPKIDYLVSASSDSLNINGHGFVDNL